MKNSNRPNCSIVTAILLMFCSVQFTGCALFVGKKNDKVPPEQVTEDRSGVTGVATNCLGDILYYCCQTACVKHARALEFEDEFMAALAETVSDPTARRRVLSHIEFDFVTATVCSNELDITFSVVNSGGVLQSAAISTQELAGSGSGGARGGIKNVLNYFASHEAGDPTLFLRITLPICPSGGAGSPTISQTSCTRSNISEPIRSAGEGESFYITDSDRTTNECCGTDCTLGTDTEEEITINWRGIL